MNQLFLGHRSSSMFLDLTKKFKTLHRLYSADLKGKILAIRREDQSVWERRSPLSPANVRKLVRAGATVLVQPSNRRAYPMQSYSSAGAIIKEDISDADVVFGVKQVPIDSLIPSKTYCFFSHTIKGQEANMSLLDAILDKNIRLIDYERIVDESGQRLVAFGKYAGVAGFINIIHGLGLRLLALGHHTPFMHIGPTHNYRNTEMARAAIRDCGYEISIGMMPKSIGALTFVFTGSGNVSQGAQEIFRELPFEYVNPDMLWKVAQHGETNKVYGCEVSRKDHLRRIDGGGFDPQEYDEHPERYLSTFNKTIAPWASVIVNGIYWAVNSPKLLTIPDAKTLLNPMEQPWLPNSPGTPSLPHRLLAISDVSADPGGSIEFMTECTTIDNPFCLYDAQRHKNYESFKGPGVLVCSIDNMPTQLPREATDFFGDLLLPHVPDIMNSDAKAPFEAQKFRYPIHTAVITSNGKLTPNYQYIDDLRNKARSLHKAASIAENTRKRALILGAGMVSAPAVEYLTRAGNISVTVASALKSEVDALSVKFQNTEPVLFNLDDKEEYLEKLIEGADVVVSLLPYVMHPKVARYCIKKKKNMVTGSYLSDNLKKLEAEAKNAGVLVLNECGLDPGIDHFLALECFEEVRKSGGKVESFVSYCGGLPAPECSDNPLRYRFSWSPLGVLMNTLNGAKYLENDKVVEIECDGGLMDATVPLDFLPGLSLEGIPNRDSTIYKELYGIDDAHTVLRGSLRFKGFCDAVKGLQMMGLLNSEPLTCLHPDGPEISWRQLMCILMGQDPNIFIENVKKHVLQRIGGSKYRMAAIEQLGLLSEDPITKMNTPLNTLSNYLAKLLAIGPQDRDMVVLRHDVRIVWPDKRRERRGITLVSYGDLNGYSAMARTVGYPVGIATKMVLNGEIQGSGMILPFRPEVYGPILNRLKLEGIEARESSTFE